MMKRESTQTVIPAEPAATPKELEFARELLAQCAEALLDGALPSPEARAFVGGALLSWLREGGEPGALERRFFKVTRPVLELARLSFEGLYQYAEQIDVALWRGELTPDEAGAELEMIVKLLRVREEDKRARSPSGRG